MLAFWNTYIYLPFYNILIALVSVLPGHSVGLAIIVLTVLVKIALFPLSKKASISQQKLRVIDPEVRAIREKYSTDRQAQAQHMLELYRKHQINPMSGCLPILIQIPIIIALYQLFLTGISINPERIYSFISTPGTLDMVFVGVDLAGKSLLFALLAGITQYYQTKMVLPNTTPVPPKNGEKPNLQDEIARSMQLQMKYVLPVIIAFASYTTSAAVALYFIVSNILGIAQEYIIRRRLTPPS